MTYLHCKKLLFLVVSLVATTSFAGASALPTYSITINNGQFSPASLNVKSQQRFKIKIKNIGTTPAEFENLSLRVEKVLGSQVASFVIVPPLPAGTYDFIEEFHPSSPPFQIHVQ